MTMHESRFIIRADELRAHRDARAIRAEAEAEAAGIRARLDAERSAALEKARLEGLHQGLAEAAALTASAGAAVEQFWRERNAELRDVALAVAHRILSDLPADDIMIRLASEAIAEHGRDIRLTVRMAPEAAALLRATLQEYGNRDHVTVVADPACAPGECTLVHPRGRTELGLLAQFRAMMGSLPPPTGSIGVSQ
jgi:flagellar biosynthesis/type III secretory pathway protein FliH